MNKNITHIFIKHTDNNKLMQASVCTFHPQRCAFARTHKTMGFRSIITIQNWVAKPVTIVINMQIMGYVHISLKSRLTDAFVPQQTISDVIGGPLRTYFRVIRIRIHRFSFKQMDSKLLFAKWHPSRTDLDNISVPNRRQDIIWTNGGIVC